MRVLILTPTALPFVTGNAITAERWRRSLSKKGIGVEVLATQGIHALIDDRKSDTGSCQTLLLRRILTYCIELKFFCHNKKAQPI